MKKLLFLTVVFVLLIASTGLAKEGFYLGAFMPTETISGDAGTNVASGTGWGLRGGVGFNRYFSIEANYGTTKHDVDYTTYTATMNLNSLSGYAKLNFPLTSLDSAQIMTVEPYVKAGIGHYETSTSGYSNSSKSDGFQWGVGIELYLFRELSVQAGWTTTDVNFKQSGIEYKGAVKTVDFGVIYHFI